MGDGVTGSERRNAPSPEPGEGVGGEANVDRLGTARCGLLVARGLVPALTLATPLRRVVLIVPIAHLHSSHDWIPMVLIPLDAQLVVDVPDAGDGLQDVLG